MYVVVARVRVLKVVGKMAVRGGHWFLIQFSEMISAIQTAAEQAAHAVSQENLKVLKSYFRLADEGRDSDREAAAASPADIEHLVPLTVAMHYPMVTANGVEDHEVFVPLISLAPISNLQLSEIEIEMDLEILEKDGDLQVGFPQLKHNILFGDKVVSPKPNAKITIKIGSGGRTQGVKTLIEGYDKALRAQIPG